MIKTAFYEGFYKAAGARQILGDRVYRKLLHQNINEQGMVGTALTYASKKILGKKRTHKIMMALNKPALEVDTVAGDYLDRGMQKLKFGKNLFKQNERVRSNPKNFKNRRSALKHEQIVERPSLVAPLVKATDIAKPIVFGLATDKAIRDLRKKKHEQQPEENSRTENAPATF